MKTCQSCGYPNPDSLNQCYKCTHTLPALTDAQLIAQNQRMSVQAAQHAQLRQQAAVGQHVSVHNKYWALNIVASFFEIIGAIAMVVAAVGFIVGVVVSIYEKNWQAVPIGIAVLVGSFFSGVVTYAMGQMIRVQMDTEFNTRRQVDLLEAQARQITTVV